MPKTRKHKSILVTGGAGFIGSAVIRQYIEATDITVINVDKLTYAGDLATIASVADNSRYMFEQGIQWNDPVIGINWPGNEFIISEKDSHNRLLQDMDDKLPIYKGMEKG